MVLSLRFVYVCVCVSGVDDAKREFKARRHRLVICAESVWKALGLPHVVVTVATIGAVQTTPQRWCISGCMQ